VTGFCQTTEHGRAHKARRTGHRVVIVGSFVALVDILLYIKFDEVKTIAGFVFTIAFIKFNIEKNIQPRATKGNPTMTTLLTGATGFVGAAVLRCLTEAVTISVSSSSAQRSSQSVRVSIVRFSREISPSRSHSGLRCRVAIPCFTSPQITVFGCLIARNEPRQYQGQST